MNNKGLLGLNILNLPLLYAYFFLSKYTLVRKHVIPRRLEDEYELLNT